jgi:hypothetical protein
MHSKLPINTCSSPISPAMHVFDVGFKRERVRRKLMEMRGWNIRVFLDS